MAERRREVKIPRLEEGGEFLLPKEHQEAPHKETESHRTAAPVHAIVSDTNEMPYPSSEPLTQKRIEKILEEDLGEVYLALSPQLRVKFAKRGEEVAKKIKIMVASAKVVVRKVLDLIREWLSMIPGINRFYLEQEAKLKTDKILFMIGEGHGV